MDCIGKPIDDVLIRSLIRPRPADGHKGTFGHALIMAGNTGRMGAALLSATAALHAGCGLLTVYSTSKIYPPLLSRLPEAMLIPRKKKRGLPDLTPFQAVGFGPGIGVDDAGSALLAALLQGCRKPLVIDADGITLLSKRAEWYHLLTPQMILTPHPGEFDRLTRKHDSTEERVQSQLAFSKSYQAIVVLKGHTTTIAFPDGQLYTNTTGNNGMATAGSGDVLTGIITSLCAQAYEPRDAALLGVYLHGYAGDAAARRYSHTSMIASQIIEGLADFFLAYEHIQF